MSCSQVGTRRGLAGGPTEAGCPVPPPVLTGSGSTGLLHQHLRQCHPAGGTKVNTSAAQTCGLGFWVLKAHQRDIYDEAEITRESSFHHCDLEALQDTDASEVVHRLVTSVEQSLISSPS